MDKLALIRQPIEQELKLYQELFEKDFTSENPLLHMALQHIRKKQGKRMRPILTLLAARAVGGVGQPVLPSAVLHAAVSLEVLHTASLVHDDIIDESDKRRGQPTLHTFLGTTPSILVGDYLLARSIHHSAQTRCTAAVDAIARIAELLANGELLQMYTIDSDTISEQVYYDVIRRKTACVFATAAQLGALLSSQASTSCTTNGVGDTPVLVEALRLFGENLGIAFQIRDDMLDYADSTQLGKPTGNDMREGKLTLPVIHAVSEQPSLLPLALKVRHGEADDNDIAQLIDATIQQGGLVYAERMTQQFVDLAIASLSALAPSVYRDALVLFAKLVVQRTV
ncbi:MAG: polyprenyl synthetase family protein [Bacteroidales bacterium]|nr:polyprenyl synthetase family protein [Candidatus Physcousia equi]